MYPSINDVIIKDDIDLINSVSSISVFNILILDVLLSIWLNKIAPLNFDSISCSIEWCFELLHKWEDVEGMLSKFNERGVNDGSVFDGDNDVKLRPFDFFI